VTRSMRARLFSSAATLCRSRSSASASLLRVVNRSQRIGSPNKPAQSEESGLYGANQVFQRHPPVSAAAPGGMEKYGCINILFAKGVGFLA
jgi:hypothetical protein